MAFEDQIKTIVAQVLKVSIDSVHEDAYLVDDLDTDPYGLDDLAVVLSEELDIEIEEEEVEVWYTVAEIIQTVFDKMEQ